MTSAQVVTDAKLDRMFARNALAQLIDRLYLLRTSELQQLKAALETEVCNREASHVGAMEN